MSLKVIPSGPAHAGSLAPQLREADVHELRAGSGETPAEALTRGLGASSECWSVLADGEIIAMFGVCPVQEGAAAIWLLGSDEIQTHYREFARHSRGWFAFLAEKYGLLFNLVHPENHLHLRWLQWVGCEVSDQLTSHPVSGAPFIPFVYDSRGNSVV